MRDISFPIFFFSADDEMEESCEVINKVLLVTVGGHLNASIIYIFCYTIAHMLRNLGKYNISGINNFLLILFSLKVRDVKEELRSLRLEAHTKQLSKELKSARLALEQERKLRKVQSDTIKVLWREIQALQVDQESGHDRRLDREKRRMTERKLGRMLSGGSQSNVYEDSDSSRGEEQDRSVAALSQTCVVLQSQVEQLQRNLASVVQFVSERSRHSSSSQDTPPLSRPMMTASLELGGAPAPCLPSSMTMSLPPSLLLPAPVTLSKSCDSLAQVCHSSTFHLPPPTSQLPPLKVLIQNDVHNSHFCPPANNRKTFLSASLSPLREFKLLLNSLLRSGSSVSQLLLAVAGSRQVP